jgi:glycosyltransferase involved in cell wall biosynthesis
MATRSDLSADDEESLRAALGRDVRLTLVGILGTARAEVAPLLLPCLAAALARCQILHTHTVFTFPVAVAPLAARAFDKPYVVRPAGTLDETCLSFRSSGLKRLALSGYVLHNLRRAAAVHVTSPLEAADVSRLCPAARVITLSLGVRAAPVGAGAPSQPGLVGTLGRLHPIKQVELLIDALVGLPPEVKLEIAGGGTPAYARKLVDRAARAGVGERVRLLGHLDGEAKQAFLRRCSVLAFPSRHESFGLAAAEALGAGRPTLLSPSVGLAAYVAPGGAARVVPPEVGAWRSALADLLGDAAQQRRMSERAASIARRELGEEAAARRTIELYQQILAQPRRATRAGVGERFDE